MPLLIRLTSILILALLLHPIQAGAGGILHLFPPVVEGRAYAVARPSILLSKTIVTVSDSSVAFRIDQTFLNNNEFPLEGIFLLPVEAGEFSTRPEVRINGELHPCEVVTGDDFFPNLREMAVSMQDPSLLGLAGKNLLVVRSLPMGVRQQKSLRVQYAKPSSVTDETLELLVPLDGERYCLGPVGEFEVQVRFKMSQPLRTVFSPTHHLSVLREAPHRCLVTVKSEAKSIRDDFRLLTTLSGESLDVKLLCHRTPGEKGFFLAFLEPPPLPRKTEDPPRDVVFLVDCSGSMGKDDLQLARSAVLAGLERLRSHDRFNVVTMATHTTRMRDRLVAASTEEVADAVRFVNAIRGGGGTDVYNSLIDALEQFTARNRACTIVLIGHARSTVGITNAETIIDHVRRTNRLGARIFTLAVGSRADVAVLDKIATTTRGSSFHLSAAEDSESALRRFFEGVVPPKVSQLSLEIDGIPPDGLYPHPVPDLFGQESVVVLGRYDEKSDKQCRVRLSGRIQGQRRTTSKILQFPMRETKWPYVPELWAMRRLAHLVDRTHLKGPEAETREQIAALNREFGFAALLGGGSLDNAAPSRSVYKQTESLLWRLKTSFVPADVRADQFRRVDAQLFHFREGRWIDTRYSPSMPTRTIESLSGEYFTLLKNEPALGPYLALGPDVTLVRDAEAIRVTLKP